jgi:hypothetical protein
MPLSKPVTMSLKAWRTVFGEDTKVENWVKEKYLSKIHTEVKRERGPGWVQLSGHRSVVVSESMEFPEPRRGILLKGGCDLPSVFTAAPLTEGRHQGDSRYRPPYLGHRRQSFRPDPPDPRRGRPGEGR